jgi:capsular polysaccharide biosynthesis protein
MNSSHREPGAAGPGNEPGFDDDEGISLLDIVVVLAENLKLLIIGPLVVGLAALGITYLIPPTFTAKTTFLPPQQQQSSAASALASLGALSGLAGMAGSFKSPAEQYVSLLQSVSVTDRLIDEFKLMAVYDADYRFEARKELARNVRITPGKKDGLITVEVDDTNPQRAADLANRHIEELRRVTNTLALSEAQQRRLFFEGHLKASRDNLGRAQRALQSSGFNQAALRSEPKAAAEGYARLKAEVTAAEVRLQTVRRGLADNTPEVQQQLAQLGALRDQLAKLESGLEKSTDADYVSVYREF